jgi:D-beta-D-heptose 7-phosphate kinase/D-beta-D-heptose 1-phosphate adenosyltransferase
LEQNEFYRKIVSEFKGKRVAVIGDVIADKFVWGKVSRISPEAPVPVVKVQREEMMLGGSANVINNVSSLGGKVSIFGIVGDDLMGRWVNESLQAMDVDVEGLVVDISRKTSVKTRVIALKQQVVRIDDEVTEKISDNIREKIITTFKNNLSKFDAVVVSDYNKGVMTEKLIGEIIEEAKDVPVLIDPTVTNFKHYKNAFIIKPNALEACTFTHTQNEETREAVIESGREIIKRLNCQHLLITRGEHGMLLVEGDGDVVDIPTQAKDVYDVSGAGDTVISVFALGLAAKANLKDSAYISNVASGIVVGKLGTASVETGELLEALS